METLNVDESACKSCGLCAKICPMNIIALDDAGHPYKRSGGAECMDCGHCAAICPEGAIASGGAQTKPTAGIDGRTERGSRVDFLSFMKNRRSCRSFRQKGVPQELIDQALDAARYAPSAKNTQPVEWTVIADTGAIQGLAKVLLEKGRSNPELAKRYAFVDEGEDPVFRGAPVLVVVHSDPENVLFPGDGIIAAATFDLAAQAVGLGTCWSGTAYSATDAVKKLARIPESHNLHAVFMLGFPVQTWHRQPDRKAIRVHRI
jgi:nitroreductase/NAD-dependent dihydropyrimidine dehydrogenase PreA subunit